MNSFCHLLRRQHRGRLVHDQQLRLLQQAAHDLDALALADRQVVHRLAGIERQTVAFGNFDDAVPQALAVGLVVDAERDVLRDRQ